MAPSTTSLEMLRVSSRRLLLRRDLMEGNSRENIWLVDAAFKVPSNFGILPF